MIIKFVPVGLVNNPNLDVYIDWGDGNCDRVTSANRPSATHTYSELGKFRIRVKGNVGIFGSTSSAYANTIKDFLVKEN